MQSASPDPPEPGYSTGPATRPTPWHGLVVLDVLLNNLATGLFLVAASAELARPEVFVPLANAAYPTALVLLGADLLCLTLDLGDPWRFHHMLWAFKPASPMSLGTWCLTAFALPLTLLAALALLPLGGSVVSWLRWLALLAALLPAFGSAVYKGVLFSASSQPGWKDSRWLGSYFISSALLLGGAEVLALAVLLGQDRAVELLRPALIVLLLLNAVSLGLLVRDLRATLTLTCSRGKLAWLAALALGGGLAAPLALLIVGGTFPLLSMGLFLILGALVVRREIVQMPHVLHRR